MTAELRGSCAIGLDSISVEPTTDYLPYAFVPVSLPCVRTPSGWMSVQEGALIRDYCYGYWGDIGLGRHWTTGNM